MPPTKKKSILQKAKTARDKRRKRRMEDGDNDLDIKHRNIISAPKECDENVTVHLKTSGKERMKKTRLDKAYKDKETETNRIRMQASRKSEEHKKQENEKNKERMITFRKDEQYKSQENNNNRERMVCLRENNDYQSQEKESNIRRITNLRKNDHFKSQERNENRSRMLGLRQDETYKSEEKTNNAERMVELRQNELYKSQEQTKNVERMVCLRQDDTYKSQEQTQNRERMITLRENDKYQSQEKESNKERITNLRKDDQFKSQERTDNKSRMRVLRQDEVYKSQEQTNNAERMVGLRQNEIYKSQEQANNAERMVGLRLNELYKLQEQTKNVERMVCLRQDDTYKSQERTNNSERMDCLRQDDEYKRRENDENRNRIRNIRVDELYSTTENRANLQRIRTLRDDPSYRAAERCKNRENKRIQRNSTLLHHRDTLYNALISSQSDPQSCLLLSFMKQRKQLPNYICSCCEGSFFQTGVVNINRESIIEKLEGKGLLQGKRFNVSVINSSVFNYYDERRQNYVCHTCHKYINLGEVPKLASSWGLKLPPVPECLIRLNDLEERMISPCVPFMQIRTLTNRASNPQLGMKGSVIHVPVDVNEMVTSIPRNFSNLNMITIPVDFKRSMEHSSSYLRGLVRPGFLASALDFLKETELYKKYGIQPDPEFMAVLENEERIRSQLTNSNVIHQNGNDVISDEDDDPYEHIYDQDDECLLFDYNEQTANNAIVVMAPGQHQYPVSAHRDPDWEYLSFPKIYAGASRKLTNKNLSLTDTVKWQVRYFDADIPVPRLLYMAKIKLERDVLNTVQTTMRKKVNSKGVTAIQALNPHFIAELIQHNDGLKFMKHIRCSPSYWQAKKKELFALIRQIGKPTFFLTFSAVETNWPELIQGLFEYTTRNKISLTAAMDLPLDEKNKLIRDNPVFTARYFDHKSKQLMKIINNSSGPFQPFIVSDYFLRREFQQRGSPHDHILLTIENAPQISSENPESILKVIEFVDKFITCKYDEDNPYCQYLRHKHTDTCSKGRRNKQMCRFNFPKFVVPETIILEPLQPHEKSPEVKNNLQKIKDLTESFYKSKERVYKDFDEILTELDMAMDSYITAIRCSITKLTIFYKRRSCEVDINTYNPILLNLMEANTDLQFILDEYGVATYIVDYIAKAEAGLSKALKELQSELNRGNRCLQEQFRCLANKFLNSNVMSAPEAVYHCLGIPLSQTSRASIFINTGRKEDRVLFLKSAKELQALDPESTDIAGKDVITHYAERVGLNDICLSEFAAHYFHTENKRRRDKNLPSDNELEDGADEVVGIPNEIYRRRKRARIIRYVRYKLDNDPDNYYREQLLLFLPWRNEDEEIESIEWENVYQEKIDTINRNRSKFVALSDDVLEKAIQVANDNRKDIDEEEIAEFENDELPHELTVDILVQGGVDRPKNKVPFVYSAPPKIDLVHLFKTLQKLNARQLEIVMHVYKCFTTNRLPLRIFISGSAGVGKSMVISTIFQLITYYLEYSITVSRDQCLDSMKVLLCAFSGKAAFLIGGNTLHSAFALPLMESASMPDLPMDVANNLRQQLLYCKLIIIDEVSMVGSTIFGRIDTRLRQITGVNESFGGLSLITVGDFLQVSPVKDLSIFQPSKHSLIKTDISPLWSEFYLFELTEVMRQRDDQHFVHALNNFAHGMMTESDIKVIKSREVEENQVPDDAIRLYYTNADVGKYNDLKISTSKEPEIKCVANDVITGKQSKLQKTKKLKIWKEKATKDCGGYPYMLRLKKGIKYMVTANLDVSDGLVNGATGILEHVYCDPGTGEPKIIFLNFGSHTVGKKMRLQYKTFMESNEFSTVWTPIARRKYNLTNHFQKDYQAVRDQFPLVPCEALTIHKSQGQTYESVCMDFRKSGNLTRQLVYVALSRVTKLAGLYILGTFPGNMKSNNTITTSLNEMERLKSEKTLPLVFNNLHNIDGIVIAYLNTRSLRKNSKYIISDKWYSRCDVLIFAETCTYSNEDIVIPGFVVIHRSDTLDHPPYVKKNIAKGIMCFAKIGLDPTNVRAEISFSSDDKGNYHSHVDLVHFTLHDVSIVSGYKSPKAGFSNFKNVIRKIETTKVGAVLLIGDFNFNLNDTASYQVGEFKQLMCDMNLTDKLSPLEATTVLGSRLDVLYSNIEDLETGVYECYFSDHKPIFAILSDNRHTTCQMMVNESVNSAVAMSIESDVSCHNITCMSIQCSDSEINIASPDIQKKIVDWPCNHGECFPDFVEDDTYTLPSKFVFHDTELSLIKLLETLTGLTESSTNYIKTQLTHYEKCLELTCNQMKTVAVKIFENSHDTPFSAQIRVEFREIVITGDGNCQYNAISYALFGNEQFSIDLRAIAFQSVIENEELFKGLEVRCMLESNTFTNLLKTCCDTGIWGNQDTLFALSIKLQRYIYVIQQRGNKYVTSLIKPYTTSAPPIAIHLHNAGTNNAHYNVMLPVNPNVPYDMHNIFPNPDTYDLQIILNDTRTDIL